MKNTLVFSVTLLLILSMEFCLAQDYRTAIGLRMGSSNGLTVKHFFNQGAAFEGLLTTRWDGFVITGLYEFAGNAFDEPNLGWYLGGGAHLGFRNNRNPNRYYENGSIFGLDFIIGLEYTFIDIPLNLALDWKPAINLVGHHGFWGDEFAISVRFAIK